ncbi:MAG TPA: nucleotide exchange factor GrpE [Candidatus Cybelea sp.]|nr:nucleotide exchange factor GrpE [Candidatus Cybelea sp.]
MTKPEHDPMAPSGDSPAPADQASAEQPANDATPMAGEGSDQAAKFEAEIAALKDKALRAHAELENYRRRAEREREDTQKYAIAKFARELLSVADNLRRAIDAAPKEGDEALKSLLSGVEVTERELLTVFERHQIKPIEALGQRFDANLHEAVFEVPDPSKPAGTVVQVMAPGYTIAGRLLRAAMVGIAKGGPKEQTAGVNLDTSA